LASVKFISLRLLISSICHLVVISKRGRLNRRDLALILILARCKLLPWLRSTWLVNVDDTGARFGTAHSRIIVEARLVIFVQLIECLMRVVRCISVGLRCLGLRRIQLNQAT